MESIVRGEALMIFLNGESIAQATSHSFSKQTETSSVSSKDFGRWAKTTPQRINWNITSDNLMTDKGYKTFSDLQDSMQPVTAYWGYAADNADLMGLGDRAYFTLDATQPYAYGNVIITDLNLTAAAGDNATFSATLTGDGPIHFVSE